VGTNGGSVRQVGPGNNACNINVTVPDGELIVKLQANGGTGGQGGG